MTIERKRNVLTRAKAERLIASSKREDLLTRDDLAKHPNKHVRAKLARKTNALPR